MVLDNQHLSVLKQSLQSKFAIAVWRANARAMLDMVKMLSAGEVKKGRLGMRLEILAFRLSVMVWGADGGGARAA